MAICGNSLRTLCVTQVLNGSNCYIRYRAIVSTEGIEDRLGGFEICLFSVVRDIVDLTDVALPT